eukprot:8920754-Lingulodinium_polyedra.AAC.1
MGLLCPAKRWAMKAPLANTLGRGCRSSSSSASCSASGISTGAGGARCRRSSGSATPDTCPRHPSKVGPMIL